MDWSMQADPEEQRCILHVGRGRRRRRPTGTRYTRKKRNLDIMPAFDRIA